MPTTVMMLTDDGAKSAGHLYVVSPKEAERLLETRTVRTIVVNGRERKEHTPLARLATKEDLKAARALDATPKSPIVKIKFTTDVETYACGRTYGVSPAEAAHYTKRRQGRAPVAILALEGEAAPEDEPELPPEKPAIKSRKAPTKKAVVEKEDKGGAKGK